MRHRWLGTTGIVLVTLLAFPSVGHASIWDFIWKLSGPQMWGLVFHCEYDLENNRTECRFIDKRIVGELERRDQRRTWLSLDTGIYTSTGMNSEGIEFKAFETNMLALEPMFEFRSYTSEEGYFMLHHGLAGVSYDVLFGSKFDTFQNVGLKFRPIGITWGRFNASYILRVYPDGFTADQFSRPRLEGVNREAEVTHGLSVGFLF